VTKFQQAKFTVGAVGDNAKYAEGWERIFGKKETIEQARYSPSRHGMTRCQSDDDGYCSYGLCPQLRDGEPEASGRHCPFDRRPKDE
jgi:hypothetical protein